MWIPTGSQAAVVETALNNIATIYPDTVSVARSDIASGHRYTITFNSS